MIIRPPGNARARVERRVEFDPFAVDFFLDIELEFDLEDAFLVYPLGRLQEGPVQFHRLPLRSRDALCDVQEARFLELVDLAIACGDRDVVLVADLLDGPRRDLSRNENPLRVLVRE